jgi:hypothetical protein
MPARAVPHVAAKNGRDHMTSMSWFHRRHSRQDTTSDTLHAFAHAQDDFAASTDLRLRQLDAWIAAIEHDLSRLHAESIAAHRAVDHALRASIMDGATGV